MSCSYSEASFTVERLVEAEQSIGKGPRLQLPKNLSSTFHHPGTIITNWAIWVKFPVWMTACPEPCPAPGRGHAYAWANKRPFVGLKSVVQCRSRAMGRTAATAGLGYGLDDFFGLFAGYRRGKW